MRGKLEDGVTRLGMKDDLLDAQLVRTAGSAPYGGADLVECLAAAAQVRRASLDSWYTAWLRAADTAAGLAASALAAGRTDTARRAFFRASSYFRTAGVMLMGAPAG